MEEVTQETQTASEADAGLQAHYQELCRQGAALQQKDPAFQMSQALDNRRFVVLTSPEGGMSVEEAWQTIRPTPAPAVVRPVEAGISGHSANVATFSWRTATAQQRAAKKREIAVAAARGEKVYPGRM